MLTMISVFDKSQVMALPWAEAGYQCYCVDVQHPVGETPGKHENIVLVGADILDWEPPENVDFAAFFPPCTNTAVSGARWMKDKGLGSLIEALQLFKRAVDIAEFLGCPYFLENPVSTVSTYWRKPDHSFDPCDYGDPYTKKTCLWAGGGFVMPEKTRVEPVLGSKMHLMPPSENRQDLRSETPEGFARAVFEANFVNSYFFN